MGEKLKEQFHLTGDCLLVESLPNLEAIHQVTNHEGKKIDLYFAAGDTKKIDGLELNKPTFARVIARGQGFYKEEESGDLTPINLDCEVGDVVLISPMSVKWFSTLGGIVFTKEQAIGITREAEVQMRFKGEDAYDVFFAAVHDYLSTPIQ